MRKYGIYNFDLIWQGLVSSIMYKQFTHLPGPSIIRQPEKTDMYGMNLPNCELEVQHHNNSSTFDFNPRPQPGRIQFYYSGKVAKTLLFKYIQYCEFCHRKKATQQQLQKWNGGIARLFLQ